MHERKDEIKRIKKGSSTAYVYASCSSLERFFESKAKQCNILHALACPSSVRLSNNTEINNGHGSIHLCESSGE